MSDRVVGLRVHLDQIRGRDESSPEILGQLFRHPTGAAAEASPIHRDARLLYRRDELRERG